MPKIISFEFSSSFFEVTQNNFFFSPKTTCFSIWINEFYPYSSNDMLRRITINLTLPIGLTPPQTSHARCGECCGWGGFSTLEKGTFFAELALSQRWWCTGSWGTQILNDTKNYCKKCQLGDRGQLGDKNLTLGRTIFFQFCRRWKLNFFFSLKWP